MKQAAYPLQPVFLVDDEVSWTRSFGILLRKALGVTNLITFNDSREVLPAVRKSSPSLILLDLTMPKLSGDKLLEQIKACAADVPVIMVTGRNELELAVHCMKLGAHDYFIKTEEEERILGGIEKALEMVSLRNENRSLKSHLLSGTLDHPDAFAEILTKSPQMHYVFRYIDAVAQSREPILIIGESGTGKELLARAIHQVGDVNRPWVALNVAGLDDSTFSDTLFGHTKGAFTGADSARSGLIDKASGGVLFLDEIGDLQPESQVKLLRFIQEWEYYPLGSDKVHKANVKLVLATNRGQNELQNSATFRTDLYYRLRTHQITVPPLRERPEDIPVLLHHFIEEASKQMGRKSSHLPSAVITQLSTYRFPGNIRELRAIVFNAVALNRSGELRIEDFDLDPAEYDQTPITGPIGQTEGRRPLFPAVLPTIKQSAVFLVEESLIRADGNRTEAASMLGISTAALSKRLKQMRTEE